MFSKEVPSKFLKSRDDRVSNPKPQNGRSTSSQNKKPLCAKCGKGHFGKWLVGKRNCFSCSKSGYKVKGCPNLKGQDKVVGNINQVILMLIFQRRIAFILSALEVSKRLLPMW